MRTTLELDDHLLVVARTLAKEQNRSLGAVVSELAQRGLAERHSRSKRTGLPVFDVPPGAAPITPEMVREAMDES